MYILEMQEEVEEKLFASEITAFEVVAGNSAFCDANTCTRQSMC